MTTTKKKTKIVCCAAFTKLEPEARAMWRWQVVHQLCHNAAPFTVHQVAELAQVEEREAVALCSDAVERKWSWPAVNALYMGRLGKKR